MPTLLQELAERSSAENLWAADKLSAAARASEPPAEVTSEARRQMAVESAQQATDYAISRLAQAEGFWRSSVPALRKEPTGDDAERLLNTLLDGFESGLRLVQSVRALWDFAQQLGASPQQPSELDRAERRFQELAAEANLALKHRATEWRPADPDRLAEGLKQARQGKTVSADEARQWFRRG